MDIDVLKKYKKDGWLISQTHPSYPLTIWNYSQQTQFERFWDEITIQCRGLVTDESGNVVARPFKKFWNMEEGRHTPTPDYEIFEKMDGSYINVFNYKGEWLVSSRGSFTSDQAEKARELLSKHDLSKLDKSCTYIFEVIY